MTRSLRLSIVLAGICLASVATHGGIISSPPPLETPSWRGTEGSTFQHWTFDTNDPSPDPDPVDTPYGPPELTVRPSGEWVSDMDGHEGIWPLSGEIDVYIPNSLEPRPLKEIWIQVIWKVQGGDPDPSLADEPVVGIVSNPPPDSIVMQYEDTALAGGWMLRKITIGLTPNPQEEWITIKGDIWVDSVTIDTRCYVPEPTTMALLTTGLVGLLASRRRRRG